MPKLNWEDQVADEYGDESSGEIEESEQYSGSEIDLEGKTPVVLLGEMYFVNLPEKRKGDLRLLDDGVATPEEAYRMAELLRCLKQRRPVWSADGREVREVFFSALKEVELKLAYQLRQRLRKEVP